MTKNTYLNKFQKRNPDMLTELETRHKLVREFAWAVPTETAINVIVKHSPIVEMGAGTGYWGRLIAAAGGDITCYDIAPPGVVPNEYKHERQFYPVRFGSPLTLEKYPDRTLLLIWPPYKTPMASSCLRAWEGKTLIYIGEGQYGCNADGLFFEILEADFELIEQVDIPSWGHIHDSMFVYQRREEA
jgi:hypothetical protein